jgi:hypothetical protein
MGLFSLLRRAVEGRLQGATPAGGVTIFILTVKGNPRISYTVSCDVLCEGAPGRWRWSHPPAVAFGAHVRPVTISILTAKGNPRISLWIRSAHSKWWSVKYLTYLKICTRVRDDGSLFLSVLVREIADRSGFVIGIKRFSYV